MTDVLFYHLERASLESVLPNLLERTLERGWKAVVRCGARESVARLDEILWTYDDGSFLPHSADLAHAAEQPVFLTADEEIPNNADLLFLVDQASVDPAAIGRFKRCVMIFDGGDETARGAARRFWKGARDAGCEATYWKQSAEGRWEKQG